MRRMGMAMPQHRDTHRSPRSHAQRMIATRLKVLAIEWVTEVMQWVTEVAWFMSVKTLLSAVRQPAVRSPSTLTRLRASKVKRADHLGEQPAGEAELAFARP